MKSFDDELNDAIQKALHDSFENFERKPRTSIDQKIYEALDKPSRIRPLLLLAAAVLLVLLGFVGMDMRERYASFQAITHSLPGNQETTESATVVPLHGNILVNPDKQTDAGDRANTHAKPAKSNTRRPRKTVAAPPKKTNILHTRPTPSFKIVRNKTRLVPAAENHIQPVAGTGHALYVQEQDHHFDHINAFDHIYPIAPGDLTALPVELILPEICLPVNTEDSALLIPMHQPVREKPDFPKYQPSDTKSFAWLFNLTATNTFQSVYLLPNADSRILKVSFPVSSANLGYKFSAGFQTLGFQGLFHYSHLSWKAEYIYAIDEFKADEEGANRYVFERLGKAETITSKVELAGIGINKQFDFKSKRTGRIFAQIGFDYSRQLQSAGQDFVTGMLSAGKILTLNKTTDLVVGPYFEYNFTKVATAEYSIKVRPNQAGVSVGVRINRTK